jgi:hypothetical protein
MQKIKLKKEHINSIILFLIIVSFFSNVSIAQLKIERKDDKIELRTTYGNLRETIFWNEGLLTEIVLFGKSEKTSSVVHYDVSGHEKWRIETNKNELNGILLAHEDASNAYYVTSEFLEKNKKKSDLQLPFLKIQKLSKTGELSEKSIDLRSEIETELGEQPTYSISYMAATKTHLVVVLELSNDKYVVISFREDFSFFYEIIDFEWNEELYNQFKIDRPQYVVFDDKLSLIQTKFDEELLLLEIKTIDLLGVNDVLVIKEELGKLPDRITRIEKGIHSHYRKSNEVNVNLRDYFLGYVPSKGVPIPYRGKLNNTFNFVRVGEQIMMIGAYKKDVDQSYAFDGYYYTYLSPFKEHNSIEFIQQSLEHPENTKGIDGNVVLPSPDNGVDYLIEYSTNHSRITSLYSNKVLVTNHENAILKGYMALRVKNQSTSSPMNNPTGYSSFIVTKKYLFGVDTSLNYSLTKQLRVTIHLYEFPEE